MWQYKDSKNPKNKQQLFSCFTKEQLSFLQLDIHRRINNIKSKEGNPFTFWVTLIEKDIYFDITDFYKGASVPNHKKVSEYAEFKINDIYQ